MPDLPLSRLIVSLQCILPLPANRAGQRWRTQDRLTILRKSLTSSMLACCFYLASALPAGAPIAAALSLTSAPATGCGIDMSCAPAPAPASGAATPAGPAACGPVAAGATCSNATGVAGLPAQGGLDVGAGNPINLINGNKYQREDDLPALPGVLGLEIVRHFNSVYATQGTTAGIFGRGWKLSYDTELYAIGNSIQIIQADGHRVNFSRNPNDPSLCASTSPGVGFVHIRRTVAGEEFTWNWTSGRVLHFDHRGKLMQIVAPGGEFVSLQRDLAGMLLQVTDPQGRRLQLRYPVRDAGAGFRGVVTIDSPVGRFGYRYGTASGARKTGPSSTHAANLASVMYPDGVGGRLYHYDDARHPAFLSGISEVDASPGAIADAAPAQRLQRIGTYLYDAQGRAILTVRGLPARLMMSADGRPLQPARLVEGTGIGQVTLDFSRAGVTVIANSLGQKTVYRHAIIGGEYRLLESIGPGCSQCGATNVRYGWRPDGTLASITRLAEIGLTPTATVFHLHDHIGRLTAELRQAYDDRGHVSGARRLLRRFEYDDASAEPRLIVLPSVVAGAEHRIAIEYGFTEATRHYPARIDESGFAPSVDGRTMIGKLTRSISYLYDSHGRRIGVDGPLPNAKTQPGPTNSDITRTDHDPVTGLVTRVIVPGGLVTQVVTRDAALRPALLRTTDGVTAQTITFLRNWRGQPLSVRIDARPAAPGTMQSADLFSTVDGDLQSRQMTYRYDAAGRLQGVTLPANRMTRFSYDPAGRVTRRLLADGSSESIGSDTESRQVLVTHDNESPDAGAGQNDAAGRYRTAFEYDAFGHLAVQTDAAGVRRHQYSDQRGRLDETIDPLGTTTRFDYDDEDNPVRSIAAAGAPEAAETRLQRDGLGNITGITDPNGITTRRWTDDFGRVIAEVSPDRGITLRRHDVAGHVVASIDETGVTSRFVYDNADRLVTKGIDGEPALTRYRYLGVRLQDVTTFASHTNQVLQQVRYRYDALGQIVQTREWLAKVDMAAGETGASSAKPSARPFTAPRVLQGLQFDTINRWDDAGRLVQQTLPDGHVVRYDYAAASVTDKAKQSTPEGELSMSGQSEHVLAIRFDDQTVVSNIRRDAVAGVVGYTHGNGVRRDSTLDAAGRIARLTDRVFASTPSPSVQSASENHWWPNGAAWFATQPPRNVVLYQQTNLHDSSGRLTALARQHTDTEGNTRPVVRNERYGYDRLDRLTRIDADNENPTLLAYDRGGNRTTQSDTADVANYRYAPGTNRLIAMTSKHIATGAQDDLSIPAAALDRVATPLPSAPGVPHGRTTVAKTSGLSVMRKDQSASESIDGIWLYHPTGVPLAQFTYGHGSKPRTASSPSGKPEDVNTIFHTIYNTAHRPIAIVDAKNQAIARYYYNAFGERIAKTVNATTTYSLFRDQRLAAQTDEDGHVTAHYIYLDGKPVAKILMQPATHWLDQMIIRVKRAFPGADANAIPVSAADAEIYAIHTDHLGTPQVVTNLRQKIVWETEITPFGRARLLNAAATARQKAPFTMDLRLPGQIFDAETGLHYNYLRDYDPALGRYLTPDPIGLAGGLQPYGYVGANPLNRTDRLGLYEEDIHYYMTYFLARAAGVDPRTASIIATADQYIDDNPTTRPTQPTLIDTAWVIISQNARQQSVLGAYHFTQSGTDDKSTDPAVRYKNPSNNQLDNLSTAANKARTVADDCAYAVMYGEYLHAFEDTFAHRAYDNKPIGINGGFGHFLASHFPDHTYNENAILGHDWKYNEARSLEMEHEVFDHLTPLANGANPNHSWEEIAPILSGQFGFNAQLENGDNQKNFLHAVTSKKIALLEKQLQRWNTGFPDANGNMVPLILTEDSNGGYVAENGKANRDAYLKYREAADGHQAGEKFKQSDFSGTLLDQ